MSLLGSFGGALMGGVKGFLSGGPVGAVAGVVQSFGGAQPGTAVATIPQSPMRPPTFGGFGVGGNVSIGGSQGIQLGYGLNVGGGTSVAATGGQCPSGYHLNKHPLAASKKHGAVPARSICVANRTMNPMNGKAAVRSIRRLKRSSKIARKILAFAGGGARARAAGRPGHKPGCGCVTCRRR